MTINIVYVTMTALKESNGLSEHANKQKAILYIADIMRALCTLVRYKRFAEAIVYDHITFSYFQKILNLA